MGAECTNLYTAAPVLQVLNACLFLGGASGETLTVLRFPSSLPIFNLLLQQTRKVVDS